jgi:hypothetical protein
VVTVATFLLEVDHVSFLFVVVDGDTTAFNCFDAPMDNVKEVWVAIIFFAVTLTAASDTGT